MNVLGSMSVSDWFSICYDIVDALKHLHQKRYRHCDIKTNNVLVSKSKTGYLIDFGKVKPILNPPAKKYANSYDYIAHEVLNGNPPTPASDIYSFGMIIKAIGETTGDTTLFELGQLSSSAVCSQRPTIIRLLSALNPYTKRSVKT